MLLGKPIETLPLYVYVKNDITQRAMSHLNVSITGQKSSPVDR